MTGPEQLAYTAPSFTTMPAPADPDSADGYDAFRDSVVAADANFGALPPWSQQYVTDAYAATEYDLSVVTTQPGWSCLQFKAIVMNRFVTIDAQFTCTQAISSDSNGSVSSYSKICFVTQPAIRPKTQSVVRISHAQINDTMCVLLYGGMSSVTPPKYELLTLDSLAIANRTIPAGATLLFHAALYNETYDA